ncbi:MAG: acetyl-CoA carboxylase biotin carboxyl carrier protein [Acidobacteria bacterium]|nr:acetyl-CoA carboxylase biotin carboxyl carrier protein [Acidobacteriota bacterium]
MNLKEIKELIDTLTEKDIAEFELERGNERIRIRRTPTSNGAPPFTFASFTPAFPMQPPSPAPPAVAPPPSASAAQVAPPETLKEKEEDLHVVKSPIVGTFYEAPSPGAPPLVQVGDTVAVGQVLCIIEAMKLMNEIEADVAGVIVKRYVSNQQPVEYGEPLFAIGKK